MNYLGFRASGIFALGLALGLFTSSALATVDPTAKALDDSRELLHKGDVKTALIRLKKVVKENPESAEARFELGSVELLVGDYMAAERDLGVAREHNYPAAKVSPQLAWAMLSQGKYEDVVKAVQPCPEDAACKAAVLAVHARAHLQMKQIDAADQETQAALEAAPNSDAARLARSLVLMAKSDYAGAEGVVDGILAANPKSAEALLLKGDLRREASDFAAAEKSYRAALDLNSRNLTTRMHLAMAIMAQNRTDEARSEIDKVLAEAPKSVLAIYLKAVLQARTNQMTAALATVRPFEKEIAKDPRGTFLLALIHAGNNNLEEALKYAGTYHSQAPDNLVGAKLLAKIEFRMGAYDRVVSLLAPLRDQLSSDADALDLLGSSYLAEGRIKEANDMLTEAVKLRPDDPTMRGRLALSHTRESATREEGIHELEDLVNRDPKNSRFDMALIATHLGNGDYDRAIAAATDMITRQPSSPLPLTMRGAAKLAKGDEAGAMSDFTAALSKDPQFVPAALYRAEMDMRGGGFDQARAVIGGILEKNPADLRGLLARAQIETRAGNASAAIPYLQQAITAHPDEIEPRAQLIRAMLAVHDIPGATAAANDLARTMPRNPAAVDLAARGLLQLGKVDDAISLYRQLQNAFPNSPEAHLRLGQAYVQAGNLNEARTAFDRAISVNAAYMPAWVNRIAVERKLNGFDAAVALAQKAQKANPANEAAKLLPGDLLMGEGRLAEAETAYRSVMAQAPSGQALIRLFNVVAKKGDPSGARRLMDDWLAKHPDDLTGRLALSDEELRTKDYHAAADQLSMLATKLPRNAVVANNLAWAYDHLNDPRAVEAAKQAYLLAPGEPQVIDTYGYMLLRKGDAKKGAELLRQAHNAMPQDPQISLHLARALSNADDPDGARKLLKPIVDSKLRFDGDDEAKSLYGQLGGS